MTHVLGVICARGGSKALPKKNIAPLCGKPLIAWTIDAAGRSRAITRTIVSTDDDEIAKVARRFGGQVPFRRPKELAGGAVSGPAVALHAVHWLDQHEGYRPDLVVYLQPTSPLRAPEDIDAAVALVAEREADAVVGVSPVRHHPYWMKTIDDSGWTSDFVEQREPTAVRQGLPPVYSLNGAIYVVRREVLLATGGWFPPRTAAYIMPRERSVDVDTAWDLALARVFLETSGE